MKEAELTRAEETIRREKQGMEQRVSLVYLQLWLLALKVFLIVGG